jgi:hypothetical protein
MKIVKLNRKFKAFRHGFTYALRFDDSHMRGSYELAKKKLEAMYGHPSWDDRQARYHPWMYVWGKRSPKTSFYIKWIYLKREEDLTLLRLSGALDES